MYMLLLLSMAETCNCRCSLHLSCLFCCVSLGSLKKLASCDNQGLASKQGEGLVSGGRGACQCKGDGQHSPQAVAAVRPTKPFVVKAVGQGTQPRCFFRPLP